MTRVSLRCSLSFVAFVFATGAWAQAADPVPLKNWAAPLSWRATTAPELAVARERAAKLNGLNAQASPASGTEELGMLVAITPCRLVDTRYDMPTPYGSGSSTPLVWAAGSQITVPAPGLPSGTYSGVANPCVGLPAAEAYSANITVWPQPAGTILKWLSVCPTGTPTATCSSTATLTGYEGGTTGTAGIVSNGAVIPADASGSFDVYVTDRTYVIIDVNGYYASIGDATVDTMLGIGALANNTGNENIAVGDYALYSNTTGGANVASGAYALNRNTTGGANVAVGDNALYSNTTGGDNTASGTQALLSNTIGNYNTAGGYDALAFNTAGSANTAIGAGPLSYNTTGSNNTAVGFDALYSNTTGAGNIALGDGAGYNLTTGSSNIDIGNEGVAGESSAIRIGQSTQQATYIAGIYGVNAGGSAVYVTSSGQLSSASSSRRYKQDIRDMGDTTDVLMGLRPVRFRYKTQGADGSEQYGLIAEEVEEVAPELVGRGLDGQVDSAHYEKVNAMLLNQVQTQQGQIEEQKGELQSQEEMIRQLQSRPAKLKSREK